MLTSAANAQSLSNPEFVQAEANYLCNFARFIDWPARTFASPDAPLEICVLGKDPIEHQLERAVRGKSAEGRMFELSSNLDVRRAKFCHILFISRSEREHTKQLLQSLAGSSVLTVSDMSDFRSMGGMVNFVDDDGRLRFDIDLGQTQRADLKLSSHLLEAARLVVSPQERK